MSGDRGAWSLLSVFVLITLVAGAVAWRLLGADDSQPAGATSTRANLPTTEGVATPSLDLFSESRPVEGAPVIRDTLWIQVVGSGLAVASRRSLVATRTAGVVQRVFVGEGDLVRQGDHLVQLDTAQAAMNLMRARAALTRARAQYEQGVLLDEVTGAVLTSDERANRERVVRAESGLTEAELAVAESEIELGLTRVTAPFTGRVGDLRAVEGAHLDIGAAVLTLVQLDPIQVIVDVLESEIGLIAEGRRAAVRFDALGGETLAGTVVSVNPRVNPGTRAARVTISLPNPGGRVLPGNYAWVSLDAEPLPDRVLVPREAITTRGERHREVVFVLKDTGPDGFLRADWRYVVAGRRNDRYVEIVPGEDASHVEPGEIVLVAGHHYLAHDTPVHLVDNVYLAEGAAGR
jgi:RND family efflux transporter MFP subunit